MEFSGCKFKRNDRIFNLFNKQHMNTVLEEYVRKTYPKRFENKKVIITENDACYMVTHHVDASPIILGKNQWKTY